MNSSELYDLFRSDAADEAKPYLWKENEVFFYMNDAYRMFTRLTGGISDFTSDVTQVAIVAGDPVGVLDKSILRIMSATRLSDYGEIKVINHTELPLMRESSYGYSAGARMDNTSGPVNAMIIGMQRNVARWVQVPVADDTAQLVVHRMPLTSITGDNQSLDEIEEDHHIHLLKWMRHLAYMKQDVDTFDSAKSDENGIAFREYCGEVKAEIDRYKYKPRVVAYGGI